MFQENMTNNEMEFILLHMSRKITFTAKKVANNVKKTMPSQPGGHPKRGRPGLLAAGAPILLYHTCSDSPANDTRRTRVVCARVRSLAQSQVPSPVHPSHAWDPEPRSLPHRAQVRRTRTGTQLGT